MLLSELKTGESGIVLKVLGHGAFRKRIMEMGFVRGKSVTVLLNAPLRDPIKYKIMDYEVSLRRSEASMIEVITEEEAKLMIAEAGGMGSNPIENPSVDNVIQSSKKSINIALVGNPNSGKTSLFNEASGSHEHVGNYGGVTVEAKRGRFTYGGYRFDIYDLPGTYSLSAYSPEEVFVRRHLIDHAPDVVVNVVAASNLERNLYLTTELIDMDCTTVMALNMYDELEQSGAQLDYDALGAMLGIPIVPTVSKTGRGIDKLFDTIINVYENNEPKLRHIHIPHTPELEEGIDAVKKGIKLDGGVMKHFAPRYLATKMLERDGEVEKMLSREEKYPEWTKTRDREAERIERVIGEDIETIIANDKYGFISGALKETYTPGSKEEVQTTRVIDSLVTHKLFGFPIFILIMWLMFECTFSLGQYPMGWIESLVGWFGDILQRTMADGPLKDMLVDGVIGGVGGVIVFLPNILILYLFISFMEDSGYMARAAFIMDKIMHRIGLHGKSFIPLIMGFGCNVPAIMATRAIESRSSRLITILINPFMSCSARLPVYVLLVGAFFSRHASLVMMALYMGGIVVGVITAKLLRRFKFKKDETPFVMELPPYRIPTMRSTLRHMWEKAAQYLRKMGGIILVASIAVWFLSYYPRTSESRVTEHMATTAHSDGNYGVTEDHDADDITSDLTESASVIVEVVNPDGVLTGEERSAAVGGGTETYISGKTAADKAAYGPDGTAAGADGASITTATVTADTNPIAAVETGGIAEVATMAPNETHENTEEYEQQKNSYIGRLGRFVAPVMKPMGFDWKASVALISGAAAKELIVSTLGVLHSGSDADENSVSLMAKLQAPDPVTGEPAMTPLSALAFLVFVLLYFPCIAALVAIAKESGSWRWAAFSFVYNTSVAWLVAFLVYCVGSLFM